MDNVEMFSSFLAGLFLVKKEITYKELSYLMSDYSMKYNKYIEEDTDELSFIDDFICFSNKMITIKNDYNDIISVNGDYISFEMFLYNLASDDIKTYFNVQKCVYDLKIKTKVLC